MHTLILCAIFGFTLAVGLLVAARHPIAASAVTVAGVGWPATLSGGSAIGFGTLALVAALAIPLVLRASSVRALAVGTAIAALVVVGAASASSMTTLGHSAALDWESWDLRGPAREASSVRFVWNSNYAGISFPPTKTVVLTRGRADRSRTTGGRRRSITSPTATGPKTCSGSIRSTATRVPCSCRSSYRSARANRATGSSSEIEIEALVDDHLAAAGTPVGLDARRFGTVFQLSGGVLRVRDPVRAGQRYRVWSYAPDPAPRALASAPQRTPAAVARFLEIDGRVFPAFSTSDRDRVMRGFLHDPSYGGYGWHTTMWNIARRVTRNASTPYRVVLALESWLRSRGGFRYDEQPPSTSGVRPLVDFVTTTKAGYCQHFAGAMTVMLRLLGIPSRVAVGFTSGTFRDGSWIVTDHDAHAWVEVWFPRYGWIPFDPTPGRGRFSGAYSFATESATALAELGAGRLPGADEVGRLATPPAAARAGDGVDVPVTAVLVLLALGGAGSLVALKTVRRRVRYLRSDPRQHAAAARAELVDWLRDQGLQVGSTSTVSDLQRVVADAYGIRVTRFADAAGRAGFASRPTRADAKRTRTELSRALRAIRGRVGTWRRLRGLFSLRSLRDG